MKLKFYMKSGNSFVVKRVKDYTFRYNQSDENIVHLKIVYKKYTVKKLLVESIKLSQIEAICRV